ncbi:MAG TPA: TolC family outer membrane protein [Acidocella sp.]|nr:TolC family outer membrane protein [Acidocella sp.]
MTGAVWPLRGLLLCGVAAGAVFALPHLAQAQEPSTLTQALAQAYENNATLQEQRASLRATDETVPTALSGWRPTVVFSETGGHVSGNETTTSTTLDPASHLLVPNKITTPVGRNESLAQISLTQPVYSGGRVVASTREAKNSVYAARAQLMATEQTVFLNVATAYVTVITDQQVLALDLSNQQVLGQQLLYTQEQFKVGEVTLTSVAQAEAALAAAKAQVEIAQGNLEIARENFHALVGAYPADKLTPPQPLVLPVQSEGEAAKEALGNNPNVVAAEFTNSASKDAVDVAFASLLPQLSLQVAGFNEQNPLLPRSEITGGEVLGELSVPLYQGGAEYSAIRTARARQQQSFAAILDAQRLAYQQATQAWVGLVSSRAAIISTNAEIKANAIALDGTEREQLVGTRTTLDVLNAQELLLNSQVQQVQNIATLVDNSYTVAAAIGRLTATDLGLPVRHYDDLKYYDAVKYAGFGTGESADRAAGVAPNGALLDASGHPITADEPIPSPAP